MYFHRENSDVCQGNLYTSDQNDLRARCCVNQFPTTGRIETRGWFITRFSNIYEPQSRHVDYNKKKKWRFSVIYLNRLYVNYFFSYICINPDRWQLVRLDIRVVSTLYRQRKFYLNVCANERVSLWALAERFNVRPVSSSLSSPVFKTRSDFQMSPGKGEGVALPRT